MMSGKATTFFWYELMTSDLDAAEAFYAAVIGWNIQHIQQPDMRYTIFETADGRGVGGALPLSHVCEPGSDVPPAWMGYIKVDDTDAAVESLKAAGGTVHKAPQDIPNVGRFAVVADPQGAGFMLMTPDGPDQSPVPPHTPGHIEWHELYAGDAKTIFPFYAGQFGWAKGTPVEMGEMGTYQLFSAGGPDTGGIMTKPAWFPVPFWLFYVMVDGGADAAAARITAHGGKVMHGPAEVPGGGWIVQAIDPQGAMFAIVADRK
jgi:predicted enzyme related to lactoylglutathione lyase